MLSAKISDLSDNIFVNFYRHEGTALMGMPAEKLKDLKDQGDIQVINEAYADRIYRQFGFLIKLRLRPGFDERGPQVNYICAKVMPHSYKLEN
jgi:lactam utilization protein B